MQVSLRLIPHEPVDVPDFFSFAKIVQFECLISQQVFLVYSEECLLIQCYVIVVKCLKNLQPIILYSHLKMSIFADAIGKQKEIHYINIKIVGEAAAADTAAKELTKNMQKN